MKAFNINTHASSNITLSLYDSRGRLVHKLVDDCYPSGTHCVNWNREKSECHDISFGTYFVLLKNDEQELVRKITVLK